MDADLLELIRSLGPGAGFIGLLVWYILRKEAAHKLATDELAKELRETKDKRIEDANRVTDRLLAITEKWHGLIENSTKAMTANTSAIDEMREAVGKLSDRINVRRPP